MPAPSRRAAPATPARHFSRAYLRHLFKAEEILGLRLMSIHNLHFLLDLVRRARSAILDGSFASFREEFMAGYRTSDPVVQAQNKARWLARTHGSREAHHAGQVTVGPPSVAHATRCRWSSTSARIPDPPHDGR